jgi:hypothetical protein
MSETFQRAKEAAGSFYLTLISVIVSLAVGFLLSKVEIDLLIGPDWSLVYWMQVLSTFVFIVLIWHEYAIGAMFYVWIIGIADSLIPLLFGAGLFGVITALGPKQLPAWFLAMSLLCLVAFLSYWYQAVRARRYVDNKRLLVELGSFSRVAMAFCFLTTVFFAAAAYAVWAHGESWLRLSLTALGTTGLVAFGFLVTIWRGRAVDRLESAS